MIAERVLRVESGEIVSGVDFIIETGSEPLVTTTTTEAPTTDTLPTTGINGYAAAFGLGLLATGIARVAGVTFIDRRLRRLSVSDPNGRTDTSRSIGVPRLTLRPINGRHLRW